MRLGDVHPQVVQQHDLRFCTSLDRIDCEIVRIIRFIFSTRMLEMGRINRSPNCIKPYD